AGDDAHRLLARRRPHPPRDAAGRSRRRRRGARARRTVREKTCTRALPPLTTAAGRRRTGYGVPDNIDSPEALSLDAWRECPDREVSSETEPTVDVAAERRGARCRVRPPRRCLRREEQERQQQTQFERRGQEPAVRQLPH